MCHVTVSLASLAVVVFSEEAPAAEEEAPAEEAPAAEEPEAAPEEPAAEEPAAGMHVLQCQMLDVTIVSTPPY